VAENLSSNVFDNGSAFEDTNDAFTQPDISGHRGNRAREIYDGNPKANDIDFDAQDSTEIQHGIAKADG